MKSYLKLIPVLLLLLFGAVVNGPAMARGGHGGGGHASGGHSGGYSHGGGGYGRDYGGVGLGIALAAPLYGLGYYSNPYYSYPSPYTYPNPAYGYQGPAVAPYGGYVEQGIPQAAPPPPPTQAQAQSQGDWYFCAASNAYYPYVRECPAGWQRVPSTPPR